jgi:flagellin
MNPGPGFAENRGSTARRRDTGGPAETPDMEQGGISMIINHNMSAVFAQRVLSKNALGMDGSIQRLSSGERINKAGDDASGLAVSEKMRSQIRGLRQAERNVQNAISFLQTAEGYMEESSTILNRIRELAVQSANGIYSTEDRIMIQVEVSQLVDEFDRVARHAQFNGMNMLTGRFGRVDANQPTDNYAPAAPPAKDNTEAGIFFHVGSNMDQREQVFIGDMTAKALKFTEDNIQTTLRIDNASDANRVIGRVDNALGVVLKQRADLGAYQNRFEYAVQGISVAAENMQAAESRIRDTDMALEMIDFVKGQMLTQAGVTMLAHANLKNHAVLKILD